MGLPGLKVRCWQDCGSFWRTLGEPAVPLPEVPSGLKASSGEVSPSHAAFSLVSTLLPPSPPVKDTCDFTGPTR